MHGRFEPSARPDSIGSLHLRLILPEDLAACLIYRQPWRQLPELIDISLTDDITFRGASHRIGIQYPVSILNAFDSIRSKFVNSPDELLHLNMSDVSHIPIQCVLMWLLQVTSFDITKWTQCSFRLSLHNLPEAFEYFRTFYWLGLHTWAEAIQPYLISWLGHPQSSMGIPLVILSPLLAPNHPVMELILQQMNMRLQNSALPDAIEIVEWAMKRLPYLLQDLTALDLGNLKAANHWNHIQKIARERNRSIVQICNALFDAEMP